MKSVSKYGAILYAAADSFTAKVIGNNSTLQVNSNNTAGLGNINIQHSNNKGTVNYDTLDIVTETTADIPFAILLTLIRKKDEVGDFTRQTKRAG